MKVLEILRVIHLGAGITALTLFWIPLVTRKGGPVHRWTGWVYACAMGFAAMSAWGICRFRLSDDDVSNDAGALFLAFVGLLVANGAGTGIRVLRTKSRTARHENILDLGLSVLLLVGSIALFGFGVRQRAVLFIAFAILGGALAVGQLRFWLRAPATKMEWWYEHMGNMLTSCIGTVTAFLVVNVPRFGLQKYALAFWLAPGVVGGIGIAVWQRTYRRKFADRSQPAVEL